MNVVVIRDCMKLMTMNMVKVTEDDDDDDDL